MSDTPVTYPIAPQGIFSTVQGEGALLGLPMVFVRCGGCTIGCPECDTDYSVVRRLTADQIADEVAQRFYGGIQWCWCTGGEFTTYDLALLISAVRKKCPGLRLALATAGTKRVQRGSLYGGWDFVSVSPHSTDGWVLRRGNQLNLVPGLNGLRLTDFLPYEEEIRQGFDHRYVTPMWGDQESFRQCLNWVRVHPGWRLGVQAHKHWNLP